MLDKGLELDFPVAQNVRVRRSAGAIFAEEIFEHEIPVFGGKIAPVQRNTDVFCYGQGIPCVFCSRTITKTVIFLPVFHEHAGQLAPLLLEAQGGDRRIDPAGHGDHGQNTIIGKRLHVQYLGSKRKR